MMGKYIYHYSAEYQQSDFNIAKIDGIAQLEHRIVCMADYKELKKMIDKDNSHKLTIKSLSFLGMEQTK